MPKIRLAVSIGFLAALILIGSLIYDQYGPDPSVHDFPVPNQALLVKEHELGKNFEWTRASEEHGIPVDYELIIKLHGWKKGEREGAAVEYTKGDHVITLISQTDVLDILKTPLH